MATGSGREEPKALMTPRLCCVLDMHGTDMSESARERFKKDGIPLSIDDYAIFDESMFVGGNPSAVKISARHLALEPSLFSKKGGASSSRVTNGYSMVYTQSFNLFKGARTHAGSGLFMEKKFVAKSFLPVAQRDDSKASSRSLEKSAKSEWVDAAFALMDEGVKLRVLPGLREVPPEQAAELVKRVIAGSGEIDSIRNGVYALRRYAEWATARFGHPRGFRAETAVVGWFLMDNLVPDDDDGHASMSLVAGLRFAAGHWGFPLEVACEPIKALAKGPSRMPKQAPSASARVAYHFWNVASNVSYSKPLRAMSAAFLVMCVAALRGIDAMRSRFDVMHDSPSNGWSFFTAVAWNSKSKGQMPWACPLVLFGSSSSWFDCLREFWGDNDFMFPGLARGASLAGSGGMLDFPASAYMILKYLREILMLPSLSLSEDEARRLRRHSFRHWIANLIRILKFPPSDAFQGGRWKEHAVMPLRYAQETQFLAQVDIIVRVVQACEAAIKRVGELNWPVFGGWELFLPSRELSPEVVDAAELREPEAEELDCDSSDDEDDGASSATAPAPPAIPAGSEPPPGWNIVIQLLSTNQRKIPHYYGPSDEYARSRVDAWRQFFAAGGVSPAGASGPGTSAPAQAAIVPVVHGLQVGDLVDVWWTDDKVYYGAQVLRVDSASDLVQVRYSLDGWVRTHHMSQETWKRSAPAAVAGGAASAAAPVGRPRGRSRGDYGSQCGDPRCLVSSVNGRHAGLCRFPPVAKRRRSSDG